MFIKPFTLITLLVLLCTAAQVLAQADTVSNCSGGTTILQAQSGFERYRWTPFDEISPREGERTFYSGTTSQMFYVQQQRHVGLNLVDNSGFEEGNIGFTSDYLNTPGGSSAQGTYSVVSSSELHNANFASCPDARTSGGLILAVDGGSDATAAVWCQTFPINPRSTYDFSFLLASLSVGNPASLRVKIDGVDVGGAYTGDQQACIWKEANLYWNATGQTTAEICIYNLNTSSTGNDFGIDEVTFHELSPVVLDSIYALIGQATTGSEEVKLCAGERYTDYGLDLGIGDSDVALLQNAEGCDSLLTVTAIQGDSLVITQLVDSLCEGETLLFDNWVITTDTVLCKTIPAQAGCDTIMCLEVRYFTPDNIDAQVSPPSCAGDVDGAITLTNLAGTGNIQYVWADGPTGPARQGLSPDTYTYTATDALGCSATASIVLNAPLPLIIEDILTVGVRCGNEQNGFAIVEVSGGTGPVEIIVEQNGNLFNIDTLGLGGYDLTIRDSLGCTVMDNLFIDGPSPVTVSLTGDTLIRLGELADHQVSYAGDNATLSLTYNDTPIDTLLNFGSLNWSPPGDGLLVATSTDENGCEASESLFVRLQSRDMEFFPNAFSPNEDGVNDRFGPARDPAIVAFEEFMIADRWGNILYRVQDCPIDAAGTCFWNGTRKGALLDSGVYIYYAVLRLIDGTTVNRRGEVTLLTTRD
ncbi:MAG: gliding motility-associated C-terminal domain-containing protein [Saprospiraceae bacterium]